MAAILERSTGSSNCQMSIVYGNSSRNKMPLVKGRATSTSRRADESLSVASKDSPELTTSHPQPQPNDDHV
ncbi:unnamed protein product [Boreogadus saida]